MTNETGLALLRQPFPANQISKLPKPTKAQTEEVKADYRKGIRCEICQSWHHPKVVHLDYVGHAALTDRLLDADPMWTWEPLSMADGLPVLDGYGGMWIKLTVCGVTRMGYGHAGDKTGGDAIKEVIGDALRNAAMRFGAALDLWHKGDLHDTEGRPKSTPQVGEMGAPVGVKAAALHASGDLGDMSAIDSLAQKIIDQFPKIGPKRAAQFIADENLDDVQTIYLSTKLPSNLNAAIKKAQAEARNQQKEPA